MAGVPFFEISSFLCLPMYGLSKVRGPFGVQHNRLIAKNITKEILIESIKLTKSLKNKLFVKNYQTQNHQLAFSLLTISMNIIFLSMNKFLYIC